MLLAGDERARTQYGNNNAYCQDNEISWLNWELDETGHRILEFTKKMIALRFAHPALHRKQFFQGQRLSGGRHARDMIWWRPDGFEMGEDEWNSNIVRCVGLMLDGQVMHERDEQGKNIYDDVLLILLNAYHDAIPFVIPNTAYPWLWKVLVDTSLPDDNLTPLAIPPGQRYHLQGRSLVVLRQAASNGNP